MVIRRDENDILLTLRKVVQEFSSTLQLAHSQATGLSIFFDISTMVLGDGGGEVGISMKARG